MQTYPLYAFDSSIREFSARVVAVEGNEVALDETAFYPGGGGQPHDTGTLLDGERRWNVTAVRKDEQYVWHTIEGAESPAVGD